MGMSDGGWRRRHAVQIVAQLPEEVEDALAVLDLAKKLVEDFLKDQPVRLADSIIVFPASANAR